MMASIDIIIRHDAEVVYHKYSEGMIQNHCLVMKEVSSGPLLQYVS